MFGARLVEAMAALAMRGGTATQHAMESHGGEVRRADKQAVEAQVRIAGAAVAGTSRDRGVFSLSQKDVAAAVAGRLEDADAHVREVAVGSLRAMSPEIQA